MEYTQAKPPKCKDCLYPGINDKKRILFHTLDELSGDELVIIRCPNLKCGSGWSKEDAPSMIVLEES